MQDGTLQKYTTAKQFTVSYDGLGLADITVKLHFKLENQQVLSNLSQISMELPICAIEDNSVIFVTGDWVSYTEQIHRIRNGEICHISIP